MNKIKNMLLILSVLAGLASKAQSYIPKYLQQQNEFIQNNMTVFDSSGWFVINRETEMTASEFITNHKLDFGLGTDDSLVLIKSNTDNLPFTTDENRYSHLKYQQRYKGLDVQFGEVFLHVKDNNVKYISAKIGEGLNLNISPSKTESQALSSALLQLGDTNHYTWLDEEYEQQTRIETGDSSSTYYPKGKLIICYTGDARDYSASNFKLAWKFTIESLLPVFTLEVYIDANTGTLLKSNSLMCTNGTADLLYYGNNGSIVSNTIQVDATCESVSKTISFHCLDCGIQTNSGTVGHIKLYPNPARNVIHIDADFIDHSSEENIIVTIVDMNGVYKFQQTYNYYLPESIDVSNLTEGAYITIVHQGDKVQQLPFTKI